jgi:phosphatidylglycerophosphate synthase
MSGNSQADIAPQADIARKNTSFLALAERRALQALVRRIPENVTSLHLSAVGFAGACLAAAGLVGSRFSRFSVALVVLGLVINWFGDSLDGTLARYRQQERPRFGFLVDHTLDLFSFIILIVAFGLSPFLSLISAFVVLLCYLLFSAYTYIRAAANHVHQMSYIGVGATEFRLLMAAWSIIGVVIGLDEPTIGRLTSIDLAICSLGALAVIGLGVKAYGDARQVAVEEGRPSEAAETAPVRLK